MGLPIEEEIWYYNIGKNLRVTFNDTLYLHPRESYVGSEAQLSAKPSTESGWHELSAIEGNMLVQEIIL